MFPISTLYSINVMMEFTTIIIIIITIISPTTSTIITIISWHISTIDMSVVLVLSRQGHYQTVQVIQKVRRSNKIKIPRGKKFNIRKNMFIFTVHHHKEGKRRRNMNKSSIEQCEKEIHRLQSSVDILRQKLEESELKETSDSIDALANQSDSKIRSIISRYVIC